MSENQNSAVIEAAGVHKRYGRGRKAVHALRDVSFRVRPGIVTGLIGPNGAGKSTFIKIALGHLSATSGRVRVLGREPGDPQALRRLGYLPENPRFPLYLSGREFLCYSGALLGLRGRELYRAVDTLLERVGIAHAGRRRVWSYSKGMAQRLGLAHALIGDPEVLILDEPMSGLDPIGRADVKSILEEQRLRGTSILFCSHILEDVERLCHEVIMLMRGRVYHQGGVTELLQSTTPAWNCLVRAAAAPQVAAVHWQGSGDGLWSVTGVDAAAVAAIAARAAAGELEIVRIEPVSEDLEAVFVRAAEVREEA